MNPSRARIARLSNGHVRMTDVARIQLGEKLSERELCPDELLAGQEAAFAEDIAWLRSRKSEFIFTACPACDGASANWTFEKTGFEFVTCFVCGTLYMNPRPSERV